MNPLQHHFGTESLHGFAATEDSGLLSFLTPDGRFDAEKFCQSARNIVHYGNGGSDDFLFRAGGNEFATEEALPVAPVLQQGSNPPGTSTPVTQDDSSMAIDSYSIVPVIPHEEDVGPAVAAQQSQAVCKEVTPMAQELSGDNAQSVDWQTTIVCMAQYLVLTFKATCHGKVVNTIQDYCTKKHIRCDPLVANIVSRKMDPGEHDVKLSFSLGGPFAALFYLASVSGLDIRLEVEATEGFIGHAAKSQNQVPVFTNSGPTPFILKGEAGPSPAVFSFLDTADGTQTATITKTVTPANDNSALIDGRKNKGNYQVAIRNFKAQLRLVINGVAQDLSTADGGIELYLNGHSNAEKRHYLANPLATKAELKDMMVTIRENSRKKKSKTRGTEKQRKTQSRSKHDQAVADLTTAATIATAHIMFPVDSVAPKKSRGSTRKR